MNKKYFNKIDSTQKYAKEKAKIGISEEVYIAKEQSSGIGRNGHMWTSELGGLYFSFITDSYNDIYTITICVAVFKALEELYGIKAKIKWPNDLLINNKKVVGIICEKVNDLVVAGIGVNTNFEEEKLVELSDVATTLKSSCNISVDNNELLDKIIENINRLTSSEVLSIFRENMAFLNEERFISQINKNAVIKGIDDNGYLIVESDSTEYKISGGII